MSVESPAVLLGTRFATELPELAVPWRAEEAPDPRLLVLDEEVAAHVGLDPAWLRTPAGVALLTGTGVPAGATPVAQGYAGHQFGQYSPRLGDGRALLLGELTAADGSLVDLHLKGSGRTPWARGGDGLAAVGPMLREHVVSTAMHALGVPTARSLGVVATGRAVVRERSLPGAVLARVAASHLRVGSVQLARAAEDPDLLRRLADHAVARHHPAAADDEHPHLALLRAVVDVQARLVARWMLLGFVHGVMNTDNVTLSGQTIDYGPCAFMEAHDRDTVFSSIDHGGRYAYGQQPVVAEWNLARLAEAMLPLLDADQDRAVGLATDALGGFRTSFSASWVAGMRAKAGVPHDVPQDVATPLVEQLQAVLDAEHPDHTSFFRGLSAVARGRTRRVDGLALPAAWLDRWLATGPDADAMDRTNPLYVPRNHLVEQALDAATAGDLGPVTELLDVVRDPFRARPGLDHYAVPGPTTSGYVTYCGT